MTMEDFIRQAHELPEKTTADARPLLAALLIADAIMVAANQLARGTDGGQPLGGGELG